MAQWLQHELCRGLNFGTQRLHHGAHKPPVTLALGNFDTFGLCRYLHTHRHTYVSTDRHIHNNENKIKKYIAHCLNDSWRLGNIMRIQVWNSGKGRWRTQVEPSMVSVLPIWEKWRQNDQELKATYQVPGEPWLHATIFLKRNKGASSYW